MPDPKSPCGDSTDPTREDDDLEIVTRVTTFGERLGAEAPPRRKLPPDHRPLPSSLPVDPTRVLNRAKEKGEQAKPREDDSDEN